MKKCYFILLFCLLPACAGFERGCSSDIAQMAGADWLVVQLNAFGEAIRCWQLQGVSIANEPNSDGIYWKDESGNLIHLSGQYNRVQVHRSNWAAAFATLGMKGDSCAENISEKAQDKVEK